MKYPETGRLAVTWGRNWFRVGGYGLRFLNHEHDPPLHYERAGHMPTLHVGRFCIGWLRPQRDSLCWVCGDEIPPPHAAYMDHFHGSGWRARHRWCEDPR